jgi:hypothetical protein
MDRVIKFQFLYKGLPHRAGSDKFCWHKKVYSLDQLMEKRIIELSDVHHICELVAKRQFTGITDNQGVDVYDGDLLRIPAKSDFDKTTYNCFEVFYHSNECIGGYNVGFCMNRMHSHGSSAGGQGYKFTPESIAKNGFVVMGNIHQSPELLSK